MKLSHLIDLAVQAGFESGETVAGGLGGQDATDRLLYVEEYPVGRSIIQLAELLGVSVEDDL